MTRLGTVISLGDPVLAELACAPWDLVWVDLEHGALSTGDAQRLALAAQAAGCEAHARLPSVGFDALPALLDAGFDGVVAPRVDSAGEAAALVARLRYPPVGIRGYGPRRAGEFGRLDAGEVTCTVQIESAAGVAAAAEIAAVDGVDAVVVGCSDLALALGAPGRLDDARLGVAVERVADVAHAAGVDFGLAGPADAGRLAALAAGRADLLVAGTDVRLYAAAVDFAAAALRTALEGFRAVA